MKTKTKVVIGAAVIAATIGLAYATPIVNLASPLFSVGQHSADINTHGVGKAASGHRFRVELETEGPSTLSIQDAAYGVAGVNGRHSHPGMVAVTLISRFDPTVQPGLRRNRL